jgi:hypothetical protein
MCGLASLETSFLTLVCNGRLTEDVNFILLCNELCARIYISTPLSFSTNNPQQKYTPTVNSGGLQMTFDTSPTF